MNNYQVLTLEKVEKLYVDANGYFPIQNVSKIFLEINGEDIEGELLNVGISYAKKRFQILVAVPCAALTAVEVQASYAADKNSVLTFMDVDMRFDETRPNDHMNIPMGLNITHIPFYVEYA